MPTWEDTVMKGKQIDAEMDRIGRLDTSYTTAELELCRTQAEITWRAREPEIAEAHKAGIRELIDWLQTKREGGYNFCIKISWDEWDAKLKEWGINDTSK